MVELVVAARASRIEHMYRPPNRRARPIVELKDEAEDKTLRPGRGRSYVSWPPMCSKKFSYFHDRPSYTVEDTGVHSEFTGA